MRSRLFPDCDDGGTVDCAAHPHPGSSPVPLVCQNRKQLAVGANLTVERHPVLRSDCLQAMGSRFQDKRSARRVFVHQSLDVRAGRNGDCIARRLESGNNDRARSLRLIFPFLWPRVRRQQISSDCHSQRNGEQCSCSPVIGVHCSASIIFPGRRQLEFPFSGAGGRGCWEGSSLAGHGGPVPGPHGGQGPDGVVGISRCLSIGTAWSGGRGLWRPGLVGPLDRAGGARGGDSLIGLCLSWTVPAGSSAGSAPG